MKKTIIYFLFLSLIIIFLTACSHGTSTPSSSSSSSLDVQLLTEPGNTTVTLDWKMISGAETYNIYWIKDASNTYSTASPPSSATMQAGTKISGLASAPYTVTGLTNDIKYWFSLSAANSTESPLTIATYSIPRAEPPPLAPDNVRANAGNTTVTVTWTPNGAQAYNIYQYTAFQNVLAGERLSTDCTGTLCSYELTGLANNTTYIFFVTSETVKGKSNEVWAIPSSSSPSFGNVTTTSDVDAPQSVNVTSAGNETVTVGWTPPSSATAYTTYNFYCDYYPAETLATMITQLASNTTSYSLSGLTNDTEYSFYLKSVLEGSPSFIYSVTPSTTPPPMAPILSDASKGYNSTYQIYLAWNAPTPITGTVKYTIYYGKARGVTKNTGTAYSAGTETSGYMTNLDSGTTYYFVVTATDNNGESAESNEKSAVAY